MSFRLCEHRSKVSAFANMKIPRAGVKLTWESLLDKRDGLEFPRFNTQFGGQTSSFYYLNDIKEVRTVSAVISSKFY